jgi:hypothetical protein
MIDSFDVIMAACTAADSVQRDFDTPLGRSMSSTTFASGFPRVRPRVARFVWGFPGGWRDVALASNIGASAHDIHSRVIRAIDDGGRSLTLVRRISRAAIGVLPRRIVWPARRLTVSADSRSA